MISEIEIEICSKETLSHIIRFVLTDNPQYFWFEGRISVRKDSDKLIVKPYYLFEKVETKKVEDHIEHALSCLNLDENASDYEKAKKAYDWILENVLYSVRSSGQNIYNVFVEREAVCKGLSKAYQLMLSKLDVFSTLAFGTIDGITRHVWNVVEIDGKYYNVDISLGYSQFGFLFDGFSISNRYRTFLKSDEELAGTHKFLETNQPHLTCDNSYKENAQ